MNRPALLSRKVAFRSALSCSILLDRERLPSAPRQPGHVLRERLCGQLQPFEHREIREELTCKIVNGKPPTNGQCCGLDHLAGLRRYPLRSKQTAALCLGDIAGGPRMTMEGVQSDGSAFMFYSASNGEDP